jgi:hypothetical protein
LVIGVGTGPNVMVVSSICTGLERLLAHCRGSRPCPLHRLSGFFL